MKYFSIFLLALFTYACKVSPPKDFSNKDIEFTCPEGWKMTSYQVYGDIISYIALEKRGLNASGLVSFTWTDYDEYDDNLDDAIEQYKTEYQSNFILKNSKLKFSATQDAKYNNIPSRVAPYTLSILGNGSSGEVIAFHHKGKTVVVLRQTADEDYELNKEGYKVLEDSFTVKQ